MVTWQVIESRPRAVRVYTHLMLVDLVARTEINRNYQKSDLLQTIRILKNYDFFKDPQMELFKPARRASRTKKPSNTAGHE